MFVRFRRSLHSFVIRMASAVILTAVSAVQVVSAQGSVSPTLAPQSQVNAATPVPSGPALVAGVAIGDCGDVSQAMVRSYQTGARRPPNPATKVCEGGRIRVRVAAERHFGHRIMDPVRVTVLLNFEPTTLVDLESLARGTITFNGQEFDLVRQQALPSGQTPVEVETQQLRDGSLLLKIEMLVQSAVPASVAPYLVFRLDLRYALGNIRDAQGIETAAPDWRVLSTPLIGLTMSSTAVAGDQFRDIALQPVQQVSPWPTLWLLIVGVFLIFFMPGLLLVQWINRHRPGRQLSREEIAWRTLDAVRASARENDGYTRAHIRRIAHAVRMYFDVESATVSEVQSRLANDPRLADILGVLQSCEGVLFEGSAIDRQEIKVLQRKLRSIIPRP